MNEDERKAFAFLLRIVQDSISGIRIDSNKMQQLQNLTNEYGAYDLDEDEFRY